MFGIDRTPPDRKSVQKRQWVYRSPRSVQELVDLLDADTISADLDVTWVNGAHRGG